MIGSVDERFKAAVTERLVVLDVSIVPILEALIRHPYPPEVVAVDFEVFSDGFTQSFPVRAFFMDADRSEYFVYVDGEATYPSPVDPGLLDLPAGVFGEDLEAPFLAEDPRLDTFGLAGEALINWFARRWSAAGGASFSRQASIGLHDDSETFDLISGEWVERL
jgi:hypothetical protein